MAKKTEVLISKDVQGSLKNVFLAGLGVINLAVEESQKNFGTLVKKGAEAQKRWGLDINLVDRKVQEIRKDIEKSAKSVR